MSVKVKLLEVLAAENSLVALMDQKLSMSLCFKLKKILKSITAEITLFQEARAQKIKEIGVPEGENSYKVLPENEEKFKKEIEELLQKEISLEFEKIEIESLPPSEKESLEKSTLSTLDWVRLEYIIA